MDDTVDTLNTGLDISTQDDASETAAAAARAGTPANGTQTDDGHAPVDGEPGEGGDEDEIEFQFGDEVSPASEAGQEEQRNAPQWIRDLRRDYAASQRRIRELEAKEKTQQSQQPTPVPTLGPRPKLDQFDYDEGKYDAALEKWYEDKRKVDAANAEQERIAQSQRLATEERLKAYNTEAVSLRIKNFRELEDEIVSVLSVEQQGILLAGADKPALLVAALGRFPNKLKSLAEIKDPVRFAFTAGKLEKELKMTNRTAAKAAPETRVSSSAGVSAGNSEKKLEQLRAEADKTGDYSRVIAYKRQLKAQQRK
ncbi:hypothetical protein [Paraburkholderia caballeronis]|uniref:hypothetical protein n=1 Tax=Paraburkholderia caballeronis TaxID=416943 RepID=UPI001064FD50|nr:hypothetical protein [Paraburkholderia caballeronis]TDV06058.1 hypothetical protein C7408_12439 [Paraburkholderia caballeronis]TDV09598.1 hypothetical protein C7406_12639 [Paraburkholderia caballeronis]TDV21663.1 hypothetical protein C7404_12139 [Paraburkholderia caballeronis]